jgi:hypothetical protein
MQRRDFCSALGAVTLAPSLSGCDRTEGVQGIVWQPDNDSVAPRGNWHRLGVTRLLVQWTAVDGLAYVANAGLPAATRLPDWNRIADEPWATEVIVGLAGRFDENRARSDIVELAEVSIRLARLPTPLNVAGWYFPIEIDPTWSEAPRLAALLNRLPRPLWVSAYDSANVGPIELAEGLAMWLPSHVGVFFQDGVGSHVREPSVAFRYVEVLRRRLGKERVRLIAEAFRPKPGGGFRPATLRELQPQLATYRGIPVYLFEARYVSDQLVAQLAAAGVSTAGLGASRS